jgi:4-aminobutyrate aminotransferase-like enzyme
VVVPQTGRRLDIAELQTAGSESATLRLGDVFWGFESQDVVPDIVTMGKPMGNDHRMAAVVTSRHFKEILDALATKHELVGDVRGHGMYLGVELVCSGTTGERERT